MGPRIPELPLECPPASELPCDFQAPRMSNRASEHVNTVQQGSGVHLWGNGPGEDLGQHKQTPWQSPCGLPPAVSRPDRRELSGQGGRCPEAGPGSALAAL